MVLVICDYINEYCWKLILFQQSSSKSLCLVPFVVSAAAKKRTKTVTPKEDEFVPTMFPCPGCAEPLKARYWKGETTYQQRTEVSTSEGFILIKTGMF